MLPMNSIEKKMYCELVLSIFDRPGSLNRSNWGEVEETYPNLFQCEHKSQILRVRVKFRSLMILARQQFRFRRLNYGVSKICTFRLEIIRSNIFISG